MSMIRRTKFTIAYLSIFIAGEAIEFLFESCALLMRKEHIRLPRYSFNTRWPREAWVPWLYPSINTVVVILGGVGLFTLVRFDTKYHDKDGKCGALGVDGDLAGAGVRIATWAQVTVLLLTSCVGMFHSEVTGAKELGAGLVLTHLSLGIALLVQMSQNTLTPVDAVVGCMILEAQNLALSMQLTAKETLAARWQVYTVIVTQMFGLIIVALLMSKLLENSLNVSECRCLTVFWWAWLGNCSPSLNDRKIFWLYYTFRLFCFIHMSFHSMYNTISFHEAEPRGGHQDHDDDRRGGPVLNISYQILDESGDPACYSEYMATISSSYAVHGVFAILAMVAAELALSKLDIQPTAAPNSIGQIIPLVISGSTAIRATWLFVRLFRKRDGLGFIWPFRRHTFGRLWPIELSDG